MAFAMSWWLLRAALLLGGLALAVGILVDEATVEIENVNTHLQQGEPPRVAAFKAASQTVMPRLLSMLSVLAVQVSTMLLSAFTVAVRLVGTFGLVVSMFAWFGRVGVGVAAGRSFAARGGSRGARRWGRASDPATRSRCAR